MTGSAAAAASRVRTPRQKVAKLAGPSVSWLAVNTVEGLRSSSSLSIAR
jgi:hypothetical protein